MLQVYKELSNKAIYLITALDRGEVLPYFQPIVELKSMEIYGYEVLARIGEKHSSAGEFISLAEKLGLSVRLDRMVYEKAFKHVKEVGYKGAIFLNLNPKALVVQDFISNIVKMTEYYEIQPEKIVFELTERETIKNVELLERFVRELKERGFMFAIDDFGSGYSSFHYLKKLPVDFVKLEGDFIKDLKNDWRDRTFVESVETLALGMNMKTVAEHVEDEETCNILRSLGVNYGQGYYFGKPSERIMNF